MAVQNNLISNTTTTLQPLVRPQEQLVEVPAPQLTNDLVILVLSYLIPQKAAQCGEVCHQWDSCATDNSLWHFFLSHHFPFCERATPSLSPQEYYKKLNSNLTKGVYASYPLAKHDSRVTSLSIRDEKLYCGSSFGNLHLLDLETDQCTATFKGHGIAIKSLAIGRRHLYLCILDGSTRVWDLRKNKWVATIEDRTKKISSLAIKKRKLYSGCFNGDIRILDLKRNKWTATLEGHDDRVTSLAIGDGKLFSSSWDGTIRVWDLTTNRCTAILEGHRDGMSSLALGNGKLFSGTGAHTIMVWNLETYQCTAIFKGHGCRASSLAYLNGRLYSDSWTKIIQAFDFSASDQTILEEIANLFEAGDPNMPALMGRFNRMPAEAKNQIYLELYRILMPFSNDDLDYGEDAFHDRHRLYSTPLQKAQAIRNYLASLTKTTESLAFL